MEHKDSPGSMDGMKYENDSFNVCPLSLSVWGRLGEFWFEPNLHMSLGLKSMAY